MAGSIDNSNRDRLHAERKRLAAETQQSYRQRALKLFPHVCGACGREFEGKRLRELTVHHKDHNHKNNPSDGSNWELLCVFCHDYEHERHDAENHSTDFDQQGEMAPSVFTQFEGLDALLGDAKADNEEKE